MDNIPKYKTILKGESILRQVVAIDFLYLKVGIAVSGTFEWRKPKKVFQSTEHTDIDGIEIYDGDIFDWASDSRGVVQKEKGQWIIKNNNGEFSVFGYCKDGRVVGNKLLNKNLLNHKNLVK